MNLGKYAEKIILGLGLILIFSSSSISSIKDYSYLSDYLFCFGGILIVIVVLKTIKNNEAFMNNTLKLYTYLYVAFVGSIILSIIVNQSLEGEIYSLEKFSLIYFFLVVLLSVTEVSERLIINALIISLTIIMISFLINHPLQETGSKAYSGGFSNSNTFGLVVVTLSSVSLVAGTSLLKFKKKSLLAIVFLLIGLGATYLTIISASRTSFLTLFIIFAIISITFTYEVLKRRNLLNWKSIVTTILIAIGGASLFMFIDNPFYTALESNIIDKFEKKMGSSRGVTDGRSDIWKDIIKNVDFFGTVNYFKESRYMHAHNSFFQILSRYGWLAASTYIIFWLSMLIKSVCHYATEKRTNPYALLPLVVIINFILLSITELVQFHIATYLAISMIAIFSKSKVSKVEMQ